MDTDIELSEIRRRKLYSRFFCTLCAVLCFLLFITGCDDAYTESPLQERVDTLTVQQQQLESQLEQCKAENEQLQRQIHTLSGLPEQLKGENIYNIQNVEIGRYTGFFDKDKDGTKEKLIVYIEPIDEQGDVIKAAADIEVELWDLSKTDGTALLAKWPAVKPDELKNLWFASMVKVNYRLTFDITDKVTSFDEPLTVKVTFTDYLSGKVFKKQKVINP
jgi:cell division protein FtsB